MPFPVVFFPPDIHLFHTIRHVYRSVWPAREVKPRFGAALVRSAHDCETGLLTHLQTIYRGADWQPQLDGSNNEIFCIKLLVSHSIIQKQRMQNTINVMRAHNFYSMNFGTKTPFEYQTYILTKKNQKSKVKNKNRKSRGHRIRRFSYHGNQKIRVYIA